ncbi:MAG: hypothetical protein AB1486_29550 [Planctomycetota bacterium]
MASKKLTKAEMKRLVGGGPPYRKRARQVPRLKQSAEVLPTA